ncbi:MAG: glycosyltransferase family 39 protein [Chloroflexi bacterium]|nr:glycosyltransferase family 39 protein [Chloroflexota bacterium]
MKIEQSEPANLLGLEDEATGKPSRRFLDYRWLLFAILALALGLRLYVWWQFIGYQLARDEVDYFRTALELYAHGQFIDPNPVWTRVPLFPLIAAGIFKITGVSVAAVNLFQILLSIINVYLVYLLGKLAFNRRVGLIGAFLFAVCPPLVTYPASFFMTEPLFTFLGSALLVTALYAVRRRSLWFTAATGVLLGLACLTRPAAIAFAPILAIWFLYYQRKNLRTAIASVATLTVLTVAVIAPWTWHNYVQYKSFILLDTVGAYNLWRDNNYDRLENPVQKLQTIPNQGDRQAYATKRGLENIISYPMQFLSGGVEKLGYLWHLELSSFATGDNWDVTYRDPGLGYILTTDAFLIVAGLLAALGLGYSIGMLKDSRGIVVVLVLLWLVATVGPAFAFHSESRFRTAYLPQMLMLTAVPLANPGMVMRFLRRNIAGSVLAAGMIGWVGAGAYSPSVWPALQSNYYVLRGDLVASADPAGALAFYEQAIRVAPKDTTGYVASGDEYRQLGRYSDAQAMYKKALARQPGDALAHLGMADALMQMGRIEDAAKHLTAVNPNEAEGQNYAWSHFEPSPATQLDIGNGAEAGTIIGFYGVEKDGTATYRWTESSAKVRFRLGAGAPPTVLSLHLMAPRPAGSLPPQVRIAANGKELRSFSAGPGWQTVDMQIPSGLVKPGQDLIIEITSDTFVPASSIPGSTDTRQVGVAVDWVHLSSR